MFLGFVVVSGSCETRSVPSVELRLLSATHNTHIHWLTLSNNVRVGQSKDGQRFDGTFLAPAVRKRGKDSVI